MDFHTYLDSLGTTADAVAESLRAVGVKGLRHSCGDNPIINGIYSACPDVWNGLRTSGYKEPSGKYYYRAGFGDDQISDPQLPKPVQDFLGKFDDGAYPDLVAKHVYEHETREGGRFVRRWRTWE